MFVNRGPDPGPYSKHGDYKPHLRVIFQARCAYCLTPDDRTGGLEGMTVDHFRCVERYSHLRLAWTNLYYACFVCNVIYKRVRPTEEEEVQGSRFVDVCAENSDDHFRLTRERKSGPVCRVKALTRVARFSLGVLRFNERPFLRDFWLDLDTSEQTAKRQLQDVKQIIKNARAILRRGDDSKEIQAVLERALTASQEISERLAAIRSKRPFPVE